MVAVIDFGSQYTQLIARRIRELNIYCEIFPSRVSLETLREKNVSAVILSGGPGHISALEKMNFDDRIFDNFFVLGICYGLQILAKHFGGEVASGEKREYGETVFYPDPDIYDKIFIGVPHKTIVWMSHWDTVIKIPYGFNIIGRTDNTDIAAMKSADGRIYGLQFHPEVVHTQEGKTILKNFLYSICGLKPEWNPGSMLELVEREIRDKVGNGRVICGLSGGVDSSTLAIILNNVCGKNALSVFVNNGLLRKGEAEKIKGIFKDRVNFKYIDAGDFFLKRLQGVVDPERKRKIIGNTFIRIFEKEARKFGAKFLAQGTLYPDVIESMSPFGGHSSRIKTHHNVGGLPEKLHLTLVEPFKFLFKDEIRGIAKEIGVPDFIINRHPFPGPGLAVRIIGSIDRTRLQILREADSIVIEEMKKADLYPDVWQAFAVLLPVKSVGVMGDKRTYENVIALRIVKSMDGMTAEWARIPYDVLAVISNRIVNEVKGINRLVYDITSKPPATIEWE
ncbi:MAG: glutamine-hydrolyzing GMP synthase [Candidatus Omnitrophica bacterium]|nr:glutamine-hydrolyzing GMP synthase [Candidatus Omnitrophota bacterium]